MIKPQALSPDQSFTTVGRVFDTPLVVVDKTWLPLTEIVVWGIMTREAGRLHPERNWPNRLGVGALTMSAILGSEWCHNLAHAAAAWLVGHPADAVRISWGMPLLVYHQIEDNAVSPRQHITRALGGPAINAIFLGLAAFWRKFTPTQSVACEVVNATLGMNTFLIFAGLLPIPGIDGGAILKWALIEQGQTPPQADETIQKVDLVTAASLGAGALAAFKKRRHFLGAIFTLFAGIALATGIGLLKEKE
jgi:Zn-dependent protease